MKVKGPEIYKEFLSAYLGLSLEDCYSNIYIYIASELTVLFLSLFINWLNLTNKC